MNNLIQSFFKFHFFHICFIIIFSFCISEVEAQSDSCEIAGPNSVPTGVHILYVTTITNPNWEVYSYDGADAQIYYFNDDTLIVETGPTNGRYTVYVLSNPGKEVLCSLNVVIDASLPVELSSFTSEVNGRKVILRWTSVSENNNSGFGIERSSENEVWKSIGFVTGNGTINDPVNYMFVDHDIPSGKYRYRLKQTDFNGTFEYFNLMNEVVIGTPGKFYLHQNFPNPFNPTTKINFDMSSDAFVKITVYDVSGKEVSILVNEFVPAGFHNVDFSGQNIAGGVYFYKIEAGNLTSVRKMLLIK